MFVTLINETITVTLKYVKLIVRSFTHAIFD